MIVSTEYVGSVVILTFSISCFILTMDFLFPVKWSIQGIYILNDWDFP